nr:MAG TPA: hypothetical protein [Bacteriophage sp.]
MYLKDKYTSLSLLKYLDFLKLYLSQPKSYILLSNYFLIKVFLMEVLVYLFYKALV